ncbi:hypothetical protein VN97_g8583 [Penicillium thymicola]|uniref:Uncharacterized protein n=1 Tax=Penicillium thymicola TaxID=293382 RepID=A0AAI9X6A7_PENTH|nr:hypothetical protein VN97_g8583 [Penicillium thymicola]
MRAYVCCTLFGNNSFIPVLKVIELENRHSRTRPTWTRLDPDQSHCYTRKPRCREKRRRRTHQPRRARPIQRTP